MFTLDQRTMLYYADIYRAWYDVYVAMSNLVDGFAYGIYFSDYLKNDEEFKAQYEAWTNHLYGYSMQVESYGALDIDSEDLKLFALGKDPDTCNEFNTKDWEGPEEIFELIHDRSMPELFECLEFASDFLIDMSDKTRHISDKIISFEYPS